MAVMTRAMLVFRDQPAVIRTMQKEAVLNIHEHYTWDKVIEHYLRLYQDSLRMCLDG